MPVIIGVNFHPVHGQDTTTFEAWSSPDIGGPAHRTKFGQDEEVSNQCSATSLDILVIAFHFSPLNVSQTCFAGRTVTPLARCVLLFTYWGVLHKVKIPQWHLAVFRLAPLISIHCRLAGRPVTITYCLLTGRYIIVTRLIVASFVCILPHDVCHLKT